MTDLMQIAIIYLIIGFFICLNEIRWVNKYHYKLAQTFDAFDYYKDIQKAYFLILAWLPYYILQLGNFLFSYEKEEHSPY